VHPAEVLRFERIGHLARIREWRERVKLDLHLRHIAPPVAATILLLSFTAGALAAPGPKTFKLTDDCEPTSFNAVLGDGACIGDGKTTFGEFIEELEATQTARAWAIKPDKARLKVGRATQVENTGGEVHTFTKVANFGGGFVADLNGISGNPVPAPECLNFGAIVFVPAGATDQGPTAGSSDLPVGRNLFQCCIHPWQRTVVEVVD
jgi:hypothetical protein